MAPCVVISIRVMSLGTPSNITEEQSEDEFKLQLGALYFHRLRLRLGLVHRIFIPSTAMDVGRGMELQKMNGQHSRDLGSDKLNLEDG